MDTENVRALAHAEIHEALARFVAKVGDEELSEVFLAAMLDHVASWFEAYLEPPGPATAADADRAWDELLRRARADLELREPPRDERDRT